jgi:hypothetical protein
LYAREVLAHRAFLPYYPAHLRGRIG